MSKSTISKAQTFSVPLTDTHFPKQEKIRIKDFDLQEFVNTKLPHLSQHFLLPNGKLLLPERILALFVDKNILLGPASNITKNKKEFLGKIAYFTEKNKPILFTLTQFAFKIPNPLKTTRVQADAGELAYLHELVEICKLIEKIYQPGAKIVILEEGHAFQKIIGVSKNYVDIYINTLKAWITYMHWGTYLSIQNLTDYTKTKEFLKNYRHEFTLLKKKFLEENVDMIQIVEATYPTIFLSLDTRKQPIEVLMKIYGDYAKDKRIAQAKEEMIQESKERAILFTSFVKTLEEQAVIEHAFPHYLTLVSSVVPGKLCIHPIAKGVKLFSYHGVPLLHGKNEINIVYEIDVNRMENIKAYYINDERTPFYYQMT